MKKERVCLTNLITHKVINEFNYFIICFLIIYHLNFDIDTKPTKKSEIGRQCSGKSSECPFDTCNGSGCKRGCTTGGCTYVGCKDKTKGENQLCDVKSGNCDKGLKCMKQDDGCDNGFGRCVKSGKSKYELYFK